MTNNRHAIHHGPQVTDVAVTLMPNIHFHQRTARLTQAGYLWGLEARTVRWRLYWLVGGMPGYPVSQKRRSSGKARVELAQALDRCRRG